MDKPKGRVYWTNDHKVFNEAGIIRIGRVGIPVRFLILLYGLFVVYKAVIGIIGAMTDPKNFDLVSSNNNWSYMWDFLWVLSPVGGLIVITFLRFIILSIWDWFADANDPDYEVVRDS